MNRKFLVLSAALAVVVTSTSILLAHCQIPCGIYDDPVRFALVREHVTTIEKSMNQINELSQQQPANWNQIVRWVGNKEEHADQLSEIVTFYFMAQRVKPADPADAAAQAKYVKQVTLLHQMLVEAMKAKQTVDLVHCQNLRALIDQFEAVYLGKAAATAVHTHGSVAHSHGPDTHTH